MIKPIRILFILYISLLLSGCLGHKPIKIGLAAEMTGVRGELGVTMRDGAQLAVDEINEMGGIQGRRIELYPRDDKGDPEIARQVDAELVKGEVVAIIGHVSSGQSAAVVDQMNEDEVVLFSPSSMSSDFSEKKDHFFRSVVSTDLMASAFADHLYKNRQITEIYCIYDLANQSFTEPFWYEVKRNFQALGGRITGERTFTSGENDLNEIMDEVILDKPAAILFVASPIDTALMIQFGKKNGLNVPYFSSSWAQTDDFIKKGGQAVEGVEFISAYNQESNFHGFIEFKEKFESRYQRSPGLLASAGYEAVFILAAALEQTGGMAEGLPEALTNIKEFEGSEGIMSIDEYGDVIRDVYITVLENGTYKTIETISNDAD